MTQSASAVGAAGVPKAAWTPSSSAGLRLWLDAAVGLTPSGDDVAAWLDQSGLNNHPAIGTAPLIDFSGWNGTRPAVLFNGETSGHHLTFNAGTLPADLSGDDKPFTMTLACQVTTNPTGERWLLGAANSTASNNQVRSLSIDASDRWVLYDRDDAGNLGRAVEASSSFDTSRHQFTLHFDGTTRTLYKDGVSIATNAAALGQSTYNTFAVGRVVRTTPQEGVNFRTPGMTIYNRALSGDELTALWNYNRARFGGLP